MIIAAFTKTLLVFSQFHNPISQQIQFSFTNRNFGFVLSGQVFFVGSIDIISNLCSTYSHGNNPNNSASLQLSAFNIFYTSFDVLFSQPNLFSSKIESTILFSTIVVIYDILVWVFLISLLFSSILIMGNGWCMRLLRMFFKTQTAGGMGPVSILSMPSTTSNRT